MTDICKYCLEFNPILLNPCGCKNLVCNSCLTQWLITLYNTHRLPKCEICNVNYSSDIVANIIAQNEDSFADLNICDELAGDNFDIILDFIDNIRQNLNLGHGQNIILIRQAE